MFLSSDNTKRLLMYYNVITMTIMVILNSCSCLKGKPKKDDRYDPSYTQRERTV
jgi:hypothetical protein